MRSRSRGSEWEGLEDCRLKGGKRDNREDMKMTSPVMIIKGVCCVLQLLKIETLLFLK